MLNVIRMEISRMFKTRSFYITMAVYIIFASVMLYFLSPVINSAFESQTNVNEVSRADGDLTVYMDFDNTAVACPSNACSPFITLGSLFISIFVACFVSDFYKNGFCKNVISKVKHRYYFQAAKAVCIMICTAIMVTLTTAVTLVTANILINNFKFIYMKDFALFLLGEYCLLTVIGLSAAFFTELFGSKVPAILYIVLSSTNIMSTLTAVANKKLSEWFSAEVLIDDYLPSLYQLKFQTDVPSSAAVVNNDVIHALILSLAAFVLYNIIGSVVISKRDVK